MENNSEETTGIFKGCVSCRKHCCLLRREKTNMTLYVSGKEYEQILAITGNADNFKTLFNGQILVKTNDNGFCPFVNDKGCILKEQRPLPCKFYPYGIMLKNNIYYLIRWTNICESFLDSRNQEEYNSLYCLIYPGLEKRAFLYNKNDEGKFVVVQQVPEMFLSKMHFPKAG